MSKAAEGKTPGAEPEMPAAGHSKAQAPTPLRSMAAQPKPLERKVPRARRRPRTAPAALGDAPAFDAKRASGTAETPASKALASWDWSGPKAQAKKFEFAALALFADWPASAGSWAFEARHLLAVFATKWPQSRELAFLCWLLDGRPSHGLDVRFDRSAELLLAFAHPGDALGQPAPKALPTAYWGLPERGPDLARLLATLQFGGHTPKGFHAAVAACARLPEVRRALAQAEAGPFFARLARWDGASDPGEALAPLFGTRHHRARFLALLKRTCPWPEPERLVLHLPAAICIHNLLGPFQLGHFLRWLQEAQKPDGERPGLCVVLEPMARRIFLDKLLAYGHQGGLRLLAAVP